jgi:hypothetical protein
MFVRSDLKGSSVQPPAAVTINQADPAWCRGWDPVRKRAMRLTRMTGPASRVVGSRPPGPHGASPDDVALGLTLRSGWRLPSRLAFAQGAWITIVVAVASPYSVTNYVDAQAPLLSVTAARITSV